jgi:sugar/nucleoside kinase (ribokinase family)
VFNCSPASKFKNLDPQMFHMTDLLVVNSLEAEALLQLSVKAEESAINACRALLSLHSYSVGVIVTMGKHGCVFGSARDSKNVKTYPARMVNAVDSIV